MHIEVEIVYGVPDPVGMLVNPSVHLRGDKEIVDDLIASEVQKLQPCESQQHDGKFTMELVMEPRIGIPWTDITAKLMKMDILAMLEKKGFKIIPNMVFDQVYRSDKLMMYKEISIEKK
jgi:hypothetical protein